MASSRIYSVPKLNLVSGVQALLHEERLKIQRELPEAPVLVSELRDFRVDFTAAGHMTFNARSGAHDDLVLALAIATWRAKSAGGPPLLRLYQAQHQQVKASNAERAPQPETGARPWRGTRADVQADAAELTKLYFDTLSGLEETNLCASCGKPLGASRTTDGVNRWCPTCPPPKGSN